jgi:pectin methylesterase-like acyl-CoA thioesterase
MPDKQNPYETGKASAGRKARMPPAKVALSKTAKAALATANTVTVDPGGATFQTIGAALGSITDNSLQKQYLLYVGPGTYNEKVTMKPYVTIQGAGQGATIITQPAASDAFSGGTVMAASNCTLANVTVSSLGGVWGSYSTALSCSGVTQFSCDNSALIADDQNQAGVNISTLNASLSTFEPPSQIILSYCTITANGQSNQSGAISVGIAQNSTAELLDSKIVATGGAQSFGVVTARASSVTLDNCFIQGASFALYDSDSGSPITANNCQINGNISNGVTVNNNPPPSGD